MPRYIVRMDDDGKAYYAEWSTVVDAPVTTFGTLDEFREYYRQEYGEAGMRELPGRLARADATGTSSLIGTTLDGLISVNRAGLGETRLTREQIVDHYVRGNPCRRGESWQEILDAEDGGEG